MCTPAASYKVSSCVETQTWRVPAVNRGGVVRAAGRIHNSEKCLKPSLFIYFLGCIICTKASIHLPGIKFQRKALRANVQHSRANRCSPGTPTTTEERSEICPRTQNKTRYDRGEVCTPAASYKVSSCVETQTWRVPAVNRGDVVRAAGRIHNSEKCLKPSLFIYFLGCIICTKASIHMPGIKFQRKALRANVQHSRANRCSPGTPTTTEERSEICPRTQTKNI